MKKVTDFMKRIVQVPDDARYGYYHGMIIYDYNSDRKKENQNGNNTVQNCNLTVEKNKLDIENER